jgi:hypothetical protein
MGTLGGLAAGFIIGGVLMGGAFTFIQKIKAATKDGALLFCSTTQQYFVIQNGKKRLVSGATPSNTDPLSELGYLVSDAISLDCSKINSIPTGPPIN